jgi:hypothetical protein
LRLSFVAAVEQLCSVGKVFRDAPSGDEAGLVTVDQKWDEFFEATCENFGNRFKMAILKRDWAEGIGSASCGGFWE